MEADLERAPAFLEHLLASPAVTEARAIDWNRADAELSTHLYAIDGDAAPFAELAGETPGIESVELTEVSGSVSYALLEVRDETVPVFSGAAEAIDRPGLVVRRLLVYRDARIYGHIVGDPAVIQSTFDELPDSVSMQIDAIGEYPSPRVAPTTTLSDRQHEAVRVALELGYYETPRQATHENIAAELDCAPNTATAHLQKGEAKLVRAGMNPFMPSG